MKNFENLSLSTERLLLRPLQDADAHALFEIQSHEQVMRYWSSVPWTSITQATDMIARDKKAMREGSFLAFGIICANDEKLIGTCTLFNLNEQCRRAEIGYNLNFQEWGKGYMHEALKALVSYGFSQLNLNRIEADIDPRNIASAKSLLRLGFTREGCLKERWIVSGEVSDSEIYGLLESDWRRKQ